MAEAILFTAASEILKKLASATSRQIVLAAGVEHDFIELEDKLSTIKAVLLDAEQKQSTNHQLRLWLERLQSVLYDADNVLDDFAYEAFRKQFTGRRNFKTKVRQFFTHSSVLFRFRMAYKIKEIRGKLVKIASDKAELNLTEGVIDSYVTMPREMTHSFVAPSDVIGRDIDTNNILHLLTSSQTDLNLSVIPIVGIGGLGKTTIAKLVYNDSRVDHCFQQKMWVCVSDNFELKKVIKNIITEVDPKGDDCSNLCINQLQNRLREIVQDKKFLLVLDDVWNEDIQKWNNLKELLMNGAKGSKIIVTTRSRMVASIMGTTNAYILERLSDDDCWYLFAKCAFEKGKEKNYPNLVEFGKAIIKKCKGVPLAVTTLGSMLFMKTDEHEWRSIEESEIWRLDENKSGILAALRLSYNQLPSHLKRCFSFCSIFPKDYQLNSLMLIHMWMSQGLLHSSVENEEWEEIGQRYIKELYIRCFFQDIRYFGKFYILFKMHDLVHDLAISVAQNESYTITNLPVPRTISNKLRHVALGSTGAAVPSIVFEWSNLWSLNYVPYEGVEGMGQSLVETCIARFKFLRMLYLQYSCFEMLPESLGSLTHLRHLDITGNRIMKKLPDAICKLFHLQTLLLNGCSELEGLPRDIGNLMNLRALAVTAKTIYLLPNKQIGLLSSLRFLWFENCPNLITCDEGIKCLPHLRFLSFADCDNLESWPGILKHLPTLETLVIKDCMKLNQLDSTDEDTHNLSFPSLGTIAISGLPQLMSFPKWIQNLTSLQQLWIDECPQISALPEEMVQLTSLTELVITNCSLLSNRCQRGREDWHKISHIPYITIDLVKITTTDEDDEEITTTDEDDEEITTTDEDDDEITTTDEDDDEITTTDEDDDEEIPSTDPTYNTL